MAQSIEKILVVDDEPDVGFILSSILSKNGYQTEKCLNLKQCNEKLESFSPDLLILDIDLPDGSGLKELPVIKKSHPDLEVIINSALDTEENRNEAQQNGASAFMGKPLNKSKLLEIIEKLEA